MMADVALLTDHRYTASQAAADDWYLANILQDDGLLQAALQRRGLRSIRVDWANPEIDWSRFRCAVFRTTWDYFHRFYEFSTWLKRIEKQTRLCNPPETIWWNLDKHYLSDLERRGIRIVPSLFLEKGSSHSLRQQMADRGWDEAILKPCISGGARHTYRLTRANVDEHQAICEQLLLEESLILQPFIHNILQQGEWTLMVFNGRYSHAVRKTAKPGDFRVQDDFGGKVHHYDPPPEMIAFAEQAVAACQPRPVYGRVDIVQDASGAYSIMELELIEPELWIRYHPPSAEDFAQGILEFLQ